MEYTEIQIKLLRLVKQAYENNDLNFINSITRKERNVLEETFELNIFDELVMLLEKFYIKVLVIKGLHSTVLDHCTELKKAILHYRLINEYDESFKQTL
ncbi:hypothetical protein AB6G22_20725 [Providencia hangzhouensis]|uniref:hypothetical protein n=1 Tax=Providencia hangzhouensis TaxID=3031799 RepID=UPI0034DCD828